MAPGYAHYRSDPRYKAILDKMGLLTGDFDLMANVRAELPGIACKVIDRPILAYDRIMNAGVS